MREIKFRAKSGTQWRYGDLYHNERGELVIYEPKTSGQTLDGVPFDGWRIKVDLETVGQFTGLHDADGCEIYEGDIVESMNGFGVVEYVLDTFLVTWRKPKALEMLNVRLFAVASDNANCHVIGNVHDNPDLLEVAHD